LISFFVTLLVSFLLDVVLLDLVVLLVEFSSFSFIVDEEFELSDDSDPSLSSFSIFYFLSHPLLLLPSVRSLTGLVSSSVPSSLSAVVFGFPLLTFAHGFLLISAQCYKPYELNVTFRNPGTGPLPEN
jgi:hypothetical protein